MQRAIALRYTDGAQAALDEVQALRDALANYHLFHASRAELLRALGQADAARDADTAALRLTANPAERRLLQQRIDWS